MHTQTNIPLAPQELKEREGVDFSTDLSPSQSNSRQSQVCSNPNQSEMMMSSHFFHIRALIRCRRTTVWGRQPVRFTWELVSHIQKQPGSPVWELLREKFCCPGALASTKHPHHHQLFTDSAVPDSVCSHANLCHRVWSQYARIGSLGRHVSSASLSESVFLRLGPLVICRARTQCFTYGLCTADLLGIELCGLLRLRSFNWRELPLFY